MIGYRDRTWCARSSECSNTECYRLMTEEEREKGLRWTQRWQPHATQVYASWADMKSDTCGYQEKKTETKA